MEREQLDDLVVVVPGILGSRLAVDGREVWGPSPGAVWDGIRTFARSVTALRLPRDIGDDHPGDGVEATGLVPSLHALPGIWPLVNGYGDLCAWLERNFSVRRALPGAPAEVPVNLVEFAYDWRLSCRYNARRLAERVNEALGRWQASSPERADARVRLICHSMGGLVARYYVECCGGAEVTRRLITLGTPHRGSLGALESLVNGHRLGLGPAGVDLTPFGRSLPSTHQLIPDYACLVTPEGLKRPGEISGGLPGVDGGLLAEAERFHAEIRTAALARVERDGPGAERLCLPVVGVRQPTPTTAVPEGERLRLLTTINGKEEGGDGRVPRFAAYPAEASPGDPTATRSSFANHGAIKNHADVRAVLFDYLAPAPGVYRGSTAAYPLSLLAPEYLADGEPLELTVRVAGNRPGADELSIQTSITGEDGRQDWRRLPYNRQTGCYEGAFTDLPAGAYAVAVHAADDSADTAVTALTLIGGIA
ncbi:hypothetical protein [Kitasatospora sp. NPDC047058]|uniref:lipase/acyltransferase domain-containing protein n=1 Tax=Kitasatospora sp. NPDC047058 TaxID=3155620 RepID=UPI003401FB70